MPPPPPAETFASRLFLGPALRTQPDRRLVTLVRGGYEIAFEEIVRRYGKPLGHYAAAIVGGRAEDVTQDAFSKALPALRSGDREIELKPWLYRIVRNTALNDLRDHPPSPETLDEAIAGGLGTAEAAERREEIAELMRRLRALPEAQRAAIVMRELEGLSHEEIAVALGVSGGAARQAIHRARATLRDGLGMLLPLPLLRLLIDHGAEAAAGGATAATGGAIAGGLGAGTALKAGMVTAVLAGSVGTGIAVQEHRGPGDSRAAAAVTTVGAEATPAPTIFVDSGPGTAEEDRGGHRRSGPDDGDSGGDDHDVASGQGFGSGEEDRGPREGQSHSRGHRGGPRGEGSEGRGHGPGRHEGPLTAGRGPRSGHGPGNDGPSQNGNPGPGGPEDGRPDRHGSEGGASGSGHDGPGSGQLAPPPPPPPTGEGSREGDGSEAGSSGSGRSGDDEELP